MEISFAPADIAMAPVLVLGVTGEELPKSIGQLFPVETQTILNRAGEAQCYCGSFDGRLGDSIEIIAPYGIDARRIILLGVGDPMKLDTRDLQRIGGHVAATTSAAFESEVTVVIERPENSAISEPDWLSNLAYGAKLRNYKYLKHRSGLRRKEPVPIKQMRFHTDADREETSIAKYAARVDGVHLARDLVNEPPNYLTPETFVERARELAKWGLHVESLDTEKLSELGMNAILAVGGASVHAPCLLLVEWRGAPERHENDIALVGKGVTFDCGGLNLKTGRFFDGMKGDMAAAAAVLGALYTAAKSKTPLNIVGVMPLVENGISGSAYRPSDIIKTARGDSIEVQDTDAEGRLILVDALWYAKEYMKPVRLISAGTLGGSGVFGLGLSFGALYSEHEEFASQLLQAGEAAGEPLWRMPFGKDLDEELEKSDIADFRQEVDMWVHGAHSGYIARLLHRSTGDIPWAHLEMCRLEWAIEDRADCPKGATGYGVRLFSQFLDDLVEAG